MLKICTAFITLHVTKKMLHFYSIVYIFYQSIDLKKFILDFIL